MALQRYARFRRPSHGFTLVELLAVIAIFSILVSLLFPSLRGAREVAYRVKCTSNLRQIGLGVYHYTQDNGHTFATRINGQSWRDLGTNEILDPLDHTWTYPGAFGQPKNIDYWGYWGIAYAPYMSDNMRVFNCPKANEVFDYPDTPNELNIDYGGPIPWRGNGEFTAYSLNGVKSWDDPALFKDLEVEGAPGRKITLLRYPTGTILAQDGYEATLEGSDTLAYDPPLSQWLNEWGREHVFYEYNRHLNTTCNVLWVDSHVTPIREGEWSPDFYYGHEVP